MILWEVWHHKYGTIYDELEKSNYVSTVDDDRGAEKIINCITKVKKLLKLNTEKLTNTKSSVKIYIKILKFI